MISTICIISILLLLQFKTDGWLEYCRLFKLNKISHYLDYELKKSNDITLDYLTYLRQYHNCFFIRLVTCPICLSIWLSMIAGAFTSVNIIPIYIVGSLLAFGIIDRLIG